MTFVLVSTSNAAYIASNAASISSNDDGINEAFGVILTEDGPYGSEGGSPWTDFNTFKENGPLTAIQIKSGGAIDALRARYKIGTKLKNSNFLASAGKKLLILAQNV